MAGVTPLPTTHSFEPDVMIAACPSRRILNHVTSRWGVLVLIALQQETMRFSALRRAIGGVSERMLAQTLQTLEADGFVIRRAHEVVPPHVEYSLSPLGAEVAAKVADLAFWIEANLDRIPHAADCGADLDPDVP
jgi:DNA-binding HxlR family transcriptional regulator